MKMLLIYFIFFIFFDRSFRSIIILNLKGKRNREKLSLIIYLLFIFNIIAPQNQKSYIYIFINSDLIIVIVIIRRGNRKKKKQFMMLRRTKEFNSIQFNSLYRRVLVIYFKFRRCRRYIHFIIQFVAFLLSFSLFLHSFLLLSTRR